MIHSHSSLLFVAVHRSHVPSIIPAYFSTRCPADASSQLPARRTAAAAAAGDT